MGPMYPCMTRLLSSLVWDGRDTSSKSIVGDFPVVLFASLRTGHTPNGALSSGTSGCAAVVENSGRFHLGIPRVCTRGARGAGMDTTVPTLQLSSNASAASPQVLDQGIATAKQPRCQRFRPLANGGQR